MRVLFLDVDGVLNREGFEPEGDGGLACWIEAELAARLTALARETDAVLVMSSSWREDGELDELRAELIRAGVAAPLVDVTPVLFGQPRWAEIQAWCIANAPAAFAILDDLPDMGPLSAYHVRTDVLVGLDDVAIAAVRALLAR
jgi:hypothetical protein